MKDTNSMCGGKLLREYWDAYAYYLVRYIKEYEELGIPIYAITIQNEPLHNTKSMPSCSWDWKGTEERDFLKNHLGPMFEKHGLIGKTQIWIYDHNWDDIPRRPAQYPQTIMDDPEAAKYADGIAFHHYSALGWSSPKLMRKFRKKYPKIPFYFSEGSLFGIWGAMRLARYIKYGSSSYNGWVFMLDTQGQPNNGPFNASNTMIQRDEKQNSVIINFDYYMYCHFTRFIKQGAKVLNEKRNRKRHYETLVCKNPEGEIICVVINKSKRERSFIIEIGGQSFNAVLLPMSINTFKIT